MRGTNTKSRQDALRSSGQAGATNWWRGDNWGTEWARLGGTMTEKSEFAISRRQFARRAALASAVASIAPARAMSSEFESGVVQATAPAGQAPAVAGLPQLPANAPKLSTEGQAEADGRFQLILAQYGGRFSEEQKADLRRLCVFGQAALERLRGYKAENGDGPGLYLKPLFEREKKGKVAGLAGAGAGKISGSGTKP